MLPTPPNPGVLARLLTVSRTCFSACSDGTRINFTRLGLSLLFTVLICGTVLAASFCEFWMNRDYRWMPLIFIFTALFYYILDMAIIMGDNGRGTVWLKRLRIFIAVVLALFNSFIIDYYFFKADIDAARIAEVRQAQRSTAETYEHTAMLKEQQQIDLLQDIDRLQGKLSVSLDSLNAEANGRGGSQRRGIADVWMAKYRAYQSDSIRANDLVVYKRNEVASLRNELVQIKKQQDVEEASVVGTVSTGINKSLELLHKIIWQEGKFTNMFMSILILLVSMLLELVPLIAKSFYNIDEYFEVAGHAKDICTTNSDIRKQNAVSNEAARLMHESSMALAVGLSEHRLRIMTEKMQHNKMMMLETEQYMDELISTEKRWEEKYPFINNKYGRPVLEKAYDALSVAAA